MAVSNPLNFDVQRIMELVEKVESSGFSMDMTTGKKTWITKSPREAKPQQAPPTGLECYQYLYDSYENVDTHLIISKSSEVIQEEKRSFQALSAEEKPSAGLGVTADCSPSSDAEEVMKIALLERLRLFEEEGELSSDACQKLRNLLICLDQIYHDQIPEEFALGSSIFTLLNLKWEGVPGIQYGSYLEGAERPRDFYLTMHYVLKNCLGLHQVFSKKFASELLNCFSSFPNKYLELASGRAMLSVAFKAVGSKGIVATDKVVPKPTFADFSVTKCDANKLLRAYQSDKPIYFISEPTIELMDELCKTALKQKEPLMIVTIGCLLKETLQKYTKGLVVIELVIPDYVELKQNSGVQLLLFNHNREQIRVCREKVPSQYLQFQGASRHRHR